MKVFVISLRNLILAGVIALVVILGAVVLLVQDPADVSSTYKDNLNAISTSGADPFDSPKPQLHVEATVEGTSANVKLTTQNFQFEPKGTKATENLTHGLGHAHLYLDGALIGKVYESDFVLKKLPKGEHELRIELVYSNHLPYKVEAVKMLQVK